MTKLEVLVNFGNRIRIGVSTWHEVSPITRTRQIKDGINESVDSVSVISVIGEPSSYPGLIRCIHFRTETPVKGIILLSLSTQTTAN